MKWSLFILILNLLTFRISVSQDFNHLPEEFLSGPEPLRFYQILPTSKTTVLFANSTSVLAELDKMQIMMTTPSFVYDGKGNKIDFSRARGLFKDIYHDHTGMKLITEGPEKVVYFSTLNNHIGLINYQFSINALAHPPFIFPSHPDSTTVIKELWIDPSGELFIGTQSDTLYIVEDATEVLAESAGNNNIYNFRTGFDRDSNVVVTMGEKHIRKIQIGKGIVPWSFTADPSNNSIIYIGTNKGIYTLDKNTGKSVSLFKIPDSSLTVTHLEKRETSITIWFSTMERGMGSYDVFTEKITFFPIHPGKQQYSGNSIFTFCRKSDNEFFVAPGDSLPAVFNTENGTYHYLMDTIFNRTRHQTTDIKTDQAGNLFVIKDGGLFWSKKRMGNPLFAEVKKDSSISLIVIKDLLINNISYSSLKNEYVDFEKTTSVKLKHDENNLTIIFTPRGFGRSDTLLFSWKLENYQNEWVDVPYSIGDEKMNVANFLHLNPGSYLFRARIKRGNEDWHPLEAKLSIFIRRPVWQEFWFWLAVVAGLTAIIYPIMYFRIRSVRKEERSRAQHQKELLEMEARALRAQMNPHFIYNCLNSIKALILNDQKHTSIEYLTTFSKLIRTLFQNSDKRRVTLYDELETCKLYIQLEAMRLNGKLSYDFSVQDDLDLKSVLVPALMIQPYIENAIWHGIVPKGQGHIMVSINGTDEKIVCSIEDDGIGRQVSEKNKPTTPAFHESKGTSLSQSRLELEKKLDEMKGGIEIIDLEKSGEAKGTKVILTINLV